MVSYVHFNGCLGDQEYRGSFEPREVFDNVPHQALLNLTFHNMKLLLQRLANLVICYYSESLNALEVEMAHKTEDQKIVLMITVLERPEPMLSANDDKETEMQGMPTKKEH